MTLTVTWTIVVSALVWMNLPRAQQMPHHAQFMGKLSDEALWILFGSGVKVEPARGALVWSQTPMILRMTNGTPLTFPASTTDEQAAFVASEYRQLLNVKANEQRGPYLLEMLALWLAPALLLVAGLALCRIWSAVVPITPCYAAGIAPGAEFINL